ncbi:MAG: MATE family efflux transporter [Oscillospiraceae bacterium]|nr:MATE family efflux transporter [Oscillospiraceae bacterium]
MLKKYIGDRAFLRRVLLVALPIMVQNAITTFVSLLDNVMVGQVGTEQMSGVAIVNGILFVFNMCVFGAVSGPGIFTAQFFGNGDHEGVRHTFRFKVLIVAALTVLGWAIFLFGGGWLIDLYLKGEGDAAVIAATRDYALQYLSIMMLSMLPFALTNAYSGTLRETGQTMVPMVASIVAVGVNLSLNYVLIFGAFGLPALGANGAAIATVTARFTELAVVAGWTHFHKADNPFIVGAYRSFHIPKELSKTIWIKGMPLLFNEFLWAYGMAFLNQCYSLLGYDVVGAMNITRVLTDLSSVAFMAMGMSVGIIVGQLMGSGASEQEVRDADRKIITIAVLVCFVFGSLMAAFSGLFPKLYDTEDSVRNLATQLICVGAAIMPFNAYTTSAYFTLRSGGKTLVTFLFDSLFVWVVIAPIAFCLSHFTALPIVPLYIICQGTDLLKCALGWYMIKRGDWIQNLAQ